MSKVVVVVVIAALIAMVRSLDFKYHSNAEIGEYLLNYTRRFPEISSLYTIGRSVKGTELSVVKISAASEDKLGIPNVKLIANIHGNEPTGREILLQFMEYIGENYGAVDRITWLVNNTRIHVLPSMNPDGFNGGLRGICEGTVGRNNAANADLNRNFPDYYHKNRYPEQPETRAMKSWLRNETFVLSASLHGGAMVVNYPFDTEKERVSLPVQPPSITPDDDVFRFLATSYANSHLTMTTGMGCVPGSTFDGGITNGAQWYSFTGGMQDYNYFAGGCMELTLELSCCKYPRPTELPKLWKENREALLQFCFQSNRGVKGLVTDAETGQGLSDVSLKIKGRNIPFRTSKNGEFWRVLLDGHYQLEILHPANNKTFTVPFEVKNPPEGYQSAKNLLIKLTPAGMESATTTPAPSTTEGAKLSSPTADRKPKAKTEESARDATTPTVPKNSFAISIATSKNVNFPLGVIAALGMLMTY